jgi:hypothetical protein
MVKREMSLDGDGLDAALNLFYVMLESTTNATISINK